MSVLAGNLQEVEGVVTSDLVLVHQDPHGHTDLSPVVESLVEMGELFSQLDSFTTSCRYAS